MMAKLNRKIEYALIALKYMKGKAPGQLTAAKEICDVHGAPFDATARVLQQMAQKGILLSEHGAHGGYQLIKGLDRISVFDLIEMISGPVGLAKCLQINSGECEIQKTCNIRSPVNYLNNRLSEFYRNISVAELLDMSYPAVPKSSLKYSHAERSEL